ncbi:T-cell surface glycoprotein CD3 epsilon chain-like [Stegostoma tigrinum]|uniref:T-cell surface glycoprotein CD3 epsilon chain-like n=1 Tax=Stegostoma tigrinum TaxID=3053191 RepID=UPI00202B7924|nr:T-cell surface glycoprotein CD3 epsilon chain-like [Stegostoma tigrinum]
MKALGQWYMIALTAAILQLGSSELITYDEKEVTLNCPFNFSKTSWHRWNTGQKEPIRSGPTHQLLFHRGIAQDHVYCEHEGKKHHFYINMKVCKDCINLDTGTVIGIICGDMLFTLLVVMGVYCFAKKRGGNSKEFRHPQFEPMETPAGRSANVTASHQQSHYAPIKSGQRDVYDKLQR